MARRLPVDWNTVAGFAGLLFLIILVGLIGIAQIRDLSRVAATLAKTDIPLQNAILGMKSQNNRYAMAIRNYMFWKGTRYLDAASVAGKLNFAAEAGQDFDAQLAFYASQAKTERQKGWAETVAAAEAELRRLGDRIVGLANKMGTTQPDERRGLEASVNKLLMDFENKLFQIDLFLDDPVQKSSLLDIDSRLETAERGRRRSTALLALSLVVGLGLGTQTARLLYRKNKREEEHKAFLCRMMIKVEEEERNNLSLQVHDEMGQDLSALKIFLGLMERDFAEGAQEGRDKITKAKNIVDGLMVKTHNISELLRPPELDDVGLIESIATLLVRHEEVTGAKTRYLRPVDEPVLAPECSLILYRVVQEALTNIAKHSEAKSIEVILKKKDEGVLLSVSDDGAGFDFAATLRRPARRREDRVRLGLRGLRERLELLGGTMGIVSKPGLGTRLEVTLPLAAGSGF